MSDDVKAKIARKGAGQLRYNERGEEIPDPTKPAVPLGFKKPESLTEQIRRLIRSEAFAREAERRGHETFEEADDFDVGEDYDPRSPYEEIFEPTEHPEVERVLVERRARRAPPGGGKEPVKDAKSGKTRSAKRATKEVSSSPPGGSGGEAPPEEED